MESHRPLGGWVAQLQKLCVKEENENHGLWIKNNSRALARKKFNPLFRMGNLA